MPPLRLAGVCVVLHSQDTICTRCAPLLMCSVPAAQPLPRASACRRSSRTPVRIEWRAVQCPLSCGRGHAVDPAGLPRAASPAQRRWLCLRTARAAAQWQRRSGWWRACSASGGGCCSGGASPAGEQRRSRGRLRRSRYAAATQSMRFQLSTATSFCLTAFSASSSLY